MKTKEALRKEIWTRLRQAGVARFPGAQGRIPNFAGAEACAAILAQQAYWKKAKVLKVNPDVPQRAIRRKALEEGKVVYMAVPRLRAENPFLELDPVKLQCSPYAASSIKGAAKYGRLVSLADVKRIDLFVCGSVAVNRYGARLGKGGGYSDLEFALLTEEKKILPKTPLVTSIHPLQIVEEEIPMIENDFPLTSIITPNEAIDCKSPIPRPQGVYWTMLPEDKIAAIPVLAQRGRN